MTHLRRKGAWSGYGLALFAACGWASGGLIGKWVLSAEAISPSTLAAARVCVASVILGTWLLLFRRAQLLRRLGARQLLFVVVFGMVVAGVQYTYFKTISLTNVATAILLEYLAPVFTLAAGVLFLKHRLHWHMVVAVVLALLGCAIAVGAFQPGGMVVPAAGVMWGLISAALFALYSMMGAKGTDRFDPWILLFYGTFFAALLWSILLGPVAIMRALLQFEIALPVLGIATVSTILAYGAFLVALKSISPTSASIAAMLEPVAAGIGAAALFGEALTGWLIIGGAIILASIAFIQVMDARQENTSSSGAA